MLIFRIIMFRVFTVTGPVKILFGPMQFSMKNLPVTI